ncbi:helix-turn-helix transcriptional regulator [Eubacteriaceae bacterium ES2]|nr:helix-turn-helix transcriptional regulator [Eubacteriaceae bacterium ES2]
MFNFGTRLKQLREYKNITQQDLANLMGLSRPTIAGYEASGKQPDQEKIVWLAKYFEVSADYLLGLTDDPTPIRNVDQDLDDGHDYGAELEAFLSDQDVSSMFYDYENWSEEEKKNLLLFLQGQEALREKKKKN